MSRLIDKLTRQRKPEEQPMGFLANRTRTEKIKMLLIAVTAADNWEKPAGDWKAADAVLIEVSKVDDLALAEKACQDKDGVPAGGWLKSASAAVVKKAGGSECDFIAFGATAPVALTQKEKLGRLMELDLNLSDSLLRAAGELPIDAVIVTGKAAELTLNLNRLMSLQRLLNLCNKPVLAAIPDNLNGAELQALWDMGIGGVLVEAADEKAPAALAELRKQIDKLETPAFRKKARALALLPHAPAEAPAQHRHEEEEEEDDE